MWALRLQIFDLSIILYVQCFLICIAELVEILFYSALTSSSRSIFSEDFLDDSASDIKQKLHLLCSDVF